MLLIRGERPEDIVAIHEVHELAFGRPAEADLVDALRASRRRRCHLSLLRMTHRGPYSLQPCHDRCR
jgi:predicted N-acetyltransferase YhbS